jgi:hypothetical protein
MYVEGGIKFGQPSFLFTLARWIYVIVIVIIIIIIIIIIISSSSSSSTEVRRLNDAGNIK